MPQQGRVYWAHCTDHTKHVRHCCSLPALSFPRKFDVDATSERRHLSTNQQDNYCVPRTASTTISKVHKHHIFLDCPKADVSAPSRQKKGNLVEFSTFFASYILHIRLVRPRFMGRGGRRHVISNTAKTVHTRKKSTRASHACSNRILR